MTQYAMIGTTELLLIAALALLLFGGKKLPELMRGLGQGTNQFKKGMSEPLEEENKKVEATKENDNSQKDESK